MSQPTQQKMLSRKELLKPGMIKTKIYLHKIHLYPYNEKNPKCSKRKYNSEIFRLLRDEYKYKKHMINLVYYEGGWRILHHIEKFGTDTPILFLHKEKWCVNYGKLCSNCIINGQQYRVQRWFDNHFQQNGIPDEIINFCGCCGQEQVPIELI